MKSPSEIPDRVFTVYQTPVRESNYYYSCRSTWASFIFVARGGSELTADDLANIMGDPRLRELLGSFYMGAPFQWTMQRYGYLSPSGTGDEGDEQGLLVSQQPFYLPDGRHHPSKPLFVVCDGVLHRFAAHDIYQSCRDLYRLMGCHKCPDAGATCLRRHLLIPLKQPPLPGLGESPHIDLQSDRVQEAIRNVQLTWDDVKETLRSGDTIAGFTYISPVLANNNPTRPGATIDAPHALSFQDLEGAREALSARTQAGVNTRRTKRVECTKCYFGGYGYKDAPSPCDQWRPRRCRHGAWTEAQVLEATIPPFEQQLKKDGYSIREFEQLLAITGRQTVLPLGKGGRRVKGIVSRLSFSGAGDFQNPKTCVVLRRTSAKNRYVQVRKSLNEVLTILPEDLRRIFDEAPSLPPTLLATAIHATVCHSVKPYICMAGCCRQVTPYISHVAVHNEWEGVEVGYWMTTYWREFHFKDPEKLQQYYGDLTAFDIGDAPDGLGFRFDVWPSY